MEKCIRTSYKCQGKKMKLTDWKRKERSKPQESLKKLLVWNYSTRIALTNKKAVVLLFSQHWLLYIYQFLKDYRLTMKERTLTSTLRFLRSLRKMQRPSQCITCGLTRPVMYHNCIYYFLGLLAKAFWCWSYESSNYSIFLTIKRQNWSLNWKIW